MDKAKPLLSSYEEIFETQTAKPSDQIHHIPLADLHPFEGHPFQVRDDDAMQETADSIAQYGVLVPGIVRPREHDGYELISGHRRKRASEIAGKDTMPVIVRNLDDDEAIIIMVDSNLQRETLLPSEKAWAYRMKLEALNHRGCKSPEMPTGTLSVELLAEQARESKSQIFRTIRLTELVPDLLDMVDAKKIAFSPAVELSYLNRKEQADLFYILGKHEVTPSLSQAQRLKKHSGAGELTVHWIEEILTEEKREPVKVTLTSKRLEQYFPTDYTPQQMEAIILRLLDGWHKKQQTAVAN